MQQQHVPSSGPRYWVALSIASVFGCNTGDAFAGSFGFTKGLPLLAILLAGVLLLERRDSEPREAYYWLAIIVVRTAATNLADFTSHALGTGAAIGLLALILLTALSGQFFFSEPGAVQSSGPTELPRTDAWYWATMLIAGTLGTALGDFSSFKTGLGLVGASLALSVAVAALLAIGSSGLLAFASYYWSTIVGVRAAGTAIGDLLAKLVGLAPSTIISGLLLLGVLKVWRRAPRTNPEPGAGDQSTVGLSNQSLR